MAKSSTDKQSKPKKARKGRGPRVVDLYPHAFDFRRPVVDPEIELAFGRSVADGKTPDPNKGVMSAKAYGDASRALRGAEANDEYGPSVPPVYSLIRRGIASNRGAVCVFAGQKSKGKKPPASAKLPKGLSESMSEKDRVYVDAKGKPIPLRCCHKDDARDLVIDRKENVLTIGKHDFVVGTNETPAVLLANGSKTGNYGANIIGGKALSFARIGSKVASLVGRFNNDWSIITLDDETNPGTQLAVAPNHLIDEWGYVERDSKRMTCAQIRAAVEKGETTGMKFKPVDEPIVGDSFNELQLWQAAKRQMALAATKRTDEDGNETTALERFKRRTTRSGEEQSAEIKRAWHNLAAVQTRVAPDEIFPFGLFNLQTKIVPVTHYGKSMKEVMVRFVIGCHVGKVYSESRAAAHYRLHPEEYEDADQPKAAKTAAPKVAKAAAPKVAKAAAPKAAKPKKDKGKGKDKGKVAQPDGEAAPVTKTVTTPETEPVAQTQQSPPTTAPLTG